MIPHEQIRETQDRSWTQPLLERLVAPGLESEELDEIARTLARLADPRAEASLLAVVEDPARPQATREAAAEALSETAWRPDGARLRRWWAEGDDWLRARALLEAGSAEADLVVPVAADPDHPLHRYAIRSMAFEFDAPAHQSLKVRALSHPDPGVRIAAADALVWDEPLIALEPLLQAAADPVPEVAIAALETLVYYPSRRCLLALAALRSRVEGPVLARLDETLDQLVGDLMRALEWWCSPPAKPRLRAWMAPVAHLLPPEEEPERAPPAPPRVAPPEPERRAAELIADYAGLDGPWAERIERFPRRMSAPELALATPFLLGHPDADLRQRSCVLFEAGDAHDALLRLARDPVFQVRKAAVYHLGGCTPAPEAEQFLWSHLQEPGTESMHAQETLVAWVAHAPRALALERLPRLAREDPREQVRYRAVGALDRLEARAEIEALLPILAEPPAITWAVHVALLDACRRLDLRAPVQGLGEVDDLHVALALAELG